VEANTHRPTDSTILLNLIARIRNSGLFLDLMGRRLDVTWSNCPGDASAKLLRAIVLKANPFRSFSAFASETASIMRLGKRLISPKCHRKSAS